MKKINLILGVFSLSALTFFSCKKDEKAAATSDMMTFTGRIGGGGAKTEIDGFEMTWSEGDQVRINGKVFDSELTSDRKTATFTGAMTLADEYEAYYPAGLYDETENKYVLPATQTCYPDSVNTLSDINPMYAKSNTTDLQFYNICAMIRLDVTGEGTVKAVKVSSATPLSGEFEIKGDASNGFYAQLKSSSSKTDHDTLTLDCGGDGVELNGTTAKKFYVAVPQGQCDSLKFTFVGANGITYSSAAGSPVLAAGTLYAKKLTDVSVVKPVPPYCVSGEFTINSGGDKVYFSKGNLYYDEDDNACHWKFESNQWDFRTYSASGIPNGDWGLFGWSTNAKNNNWGMHTKDAATSGYTDGDFKDWGGITDLPDNADGKTWRTLNITEWAYLLNTAGSSGRTDANRFAKAKVSGVKGLLIFPDGYNNGMAIDEVTGIAAVNTTGVAFPSTDIPSETWTSMETSGVVFLPAAGYRDGKSVLSVGSFSFYWSSTYSDSSSAYYMFFNSALVSPQGNDLRSYGYSVRLVR